MVYTIGCNFRCPYCHNPELVDETVETRITEREFFDFLDTRKKMLEGVVITGGEPTMHDDLPRVMREIKDRGFLVKLDTNGTRPQMLRDVIRQELVDYVAMDIKAPLAVIRAGGRAAGRHRGDAPRASRSSSLRPLTTNSGRP